MILCESREADLDFSPQWGQSRRVSLRQCPWSWVTVLLKDTSARPEPFNTLSSNLSDQYVTLTLQINLYQQCVGLTSITVIWCLREQYIAIAHPKMSAVVQLASWSRRRYIKSYAKMIISLLYYLNGLKFYLINSLLLKQVVSPHPPPGCRNTAGVQDDYNIVIWQ